jgi:signal transduction histidine kinase
LYATGWLVSAGIAAVAARMWQLHVREVEERAERAERTREEMAARRAVEERLRIARELHDSLTHSISVVQVQAGVAVHLARKRGEQVPPGLLAIQEASTDATRELHDSLTHSISVVQVQAGVAVHLARKRGEQVPPGLLAIQEASADATRELRATLGVLRSDDEADGSGLDRLPHLLARTSSAGVPARVVTTGAPRPLPPDVDQAAYRIVQEALTNVARHAGPASAVVELCYRPGGLTVQVEDDGTGSPHQPPAPGLGLIGMRERVTSLGGRLNAGPREDGGFCVRAEFPLRDPS